MSDFYVGAATLDEAVARVAVLEDKLSEVYRELRPLRVRIAELRGPAVLPRRRYQTDTQQKVARCPRCGETYEDAA